MKILKYLWRDKVDLVMFLITVICFAGYMIKNWDTTLWMGVLMGYQFAVMIRFGILIDKMK